MSCNQRAPISRVATSERSRTGSARNEQRERRSWTVRLTRWALLGGIAVIGTGTATASPASFSFGSPNAGWVPVLLSGAPVTDPQGDTPGPRDIVGDADDPMLYVAADATHLYFRLRVNSDPLQNASNLAPFGWGCFINTDSDLSTYEFSTIVDGVNNPDQISFFQNTSTDVPNSPLDDPDLPPVSIVLDPLDPAVGHLQVSPASSNFGGDADYFIDWAIERADAATVGFDTTEPASYYCGSSNNGGTIAADCSGSANDECPLDEEFSDPVSCGDLGCGICGDGAVEGTEGCDDGNLVSGDGCNSTCLLEIGESCSTDASCASDFCDPADDTCACDEDADCLSGELCSTTPAPNACVTSGCGNGLLENGEACDDGNPTDGDGCNSNCLRELGEACTLAGQCASGFCDPTDNTCACNEDTDCPQSELCNTLANPNACVAPGCGNDVLETGEACDDGNQTAGDGCNAACLLELGQPCSDSNECASGLCDPSSYRCSCDEDTDCSTGQVCDTVSNPNVCIALGCGNGVVETGESCDDSNTTPGDGCSANCLLELGQPCTDSGECASSFCDPDSDSCACDQSVDCPSGQLCNVAHAPNVCVDPGCGNNVLESGEGCDDGNVAAGDGCGTSCLIELGEPCDQSVQCESALCDPDTSTCSCDESDDCPSGQLCDVISAPNVCVDPGCGNNVLESGEGCDDGNTTPGDGCTEACLLELGQDCDDDAACDSEFCETDNDTCACDDDGDCPQERICNTSVSPSVCVLAGCGNGVLEAGEGCDDGNFEIGDGCNTRCQIELGGECDEDGSCGSGFCDEGVCACNEDDDCPHWRICNMQADPNVCVAPGCGDGTLEQGEGCDDGNTDDGDGCSADCLVENGGECTEDGDCASQLCDTDTCVCNDDGDCPDGELCNEETDPSACIEQGCGNGVVEDGEACDDGNGDDGDGCNAECEREIGEECDDDDQCASGLCDSADDTCACDQDKDCGDNELCVDGDPNLCVPEGCGNGRIENGEECDDGNGDDGDGCSASCDVETGFECADEPSECVSTACSADADCEDQQVCDEEGVCADVECKQTRDCADGEVCDEDTNTCGECFQNSDCSAGVDCNEQVHECEPPQDVYVSGNGILCAMGRRGSSSPGLPLTLVVGVAGIRLFRRRHGRGSDRESRRRGRARHRA